MKLSRMTLAVVATATLAGVAFVGQEKDTAGTKMAAAAQKFLNSLSAEQREKATYDFENKERNNWYFTPRQDDKKRSSRKGLPLEEMSEDQKQAALALVRAGTSDGGYTKATTIMSLESILNELEKAGAMVRRPGWYFFTIFGVPAK